ncbi:MAG TPA: DUF4276 family protein [Thermoanaerobaculia bacterium]|nr:DUF4276 family protein [Thermoanaerobaculia bacterium]
MIVAAIVEGHGEENSAIRTLITRVWTELLSCEFVNVLRPIRQPRANLVQRDGLLKAIDYASMRLSEIASTDRRLILLLFDADEDLPCVLVPRLIGIVRKERAHLDVTIVLANHEFETWFAAAAESLTAFFDLKITPPALDPEAAGQQKGAVRRWMQGRYSEVVDQVKLTQAMDLQMCRSRSRSFDKFCRELEKRV